MQILPKFDEGSIDVRIDGKLTEAIWQSLEPMDGMVVLEPDTLEEGPYRTLRRMFYTEKGLYLGVLAEQPVETLVPRLSGRDNFISRDDFSITIDPSGQGLYGYWFGINLGDSIEDGTVLPERQFSNQWDGPWRSATAVTENGWSGELFLPWSMMTMPESTGDTRQMGYYVSRYVTERQERWGYPALPSTKSIFMSELQPIQLEGIDPKQQFTFYPFGAVTYDNETVDAADSYKAGFDLFWRPSTNLQLTATVNPDFGNVESDNVVVNLSAIEAFFPEQRAFFLEGIEIFQTSPRARSRGRPTTLINTRRIGSRPIFPDVDGLELSDLERNQPTELYGASKITGQQGRFRFGALAAFEEDTPLNGTVNDEEVTVLQTGRDFGVARVLYEDTQGGGRRALGWISTLVSHDQGDASTHGLDYHYLNQSGQFNLDGQFVASDVDGELGYAGWLDGRYTPRRGVNHQFELDYFDDTVDLNDFGFLGRNDIWGAEYSVEFIRSDLEKVRQREREFRIVRKFNRKNQLVRAGYFAEQEVSLNNNHFIFAKLNYFPRRWEDLESNGNGTYRIRGRWDTGIFYETDSAKKLQLGGGAFYRQEDLDGLIKEYEFLANWRPNDRFSLQFFVNYVDRDGWLLHRDDRDFTTYDAEFWRPRLEADFFLSARQQFRVTMQWAGIKAFENARWQTQGDTDGELLRDPSPANGDRNFSISRLTFQARYRWEIAPLSDLFVVYTRGSNLPSDPDLDFDDSFREAFTDPLVDVFVVKLRYRLGN